MPSITRLDALRIAADHLKAHPQLNCDSMEEVFSIPELEQLGRQAPRIYGLPIETLTECWIVYGRRLNDWLLASSEIVVVSMATGDVIFAGSARDEG